MAQPPDGDRPQPQIANGDPSRRSPTLPPSLSNINGRSLAIPGLDEPTRESPLAGPGHSLPSYTPPGPSGDVDKTGEVKNVWRSDLAPTAVVSCQEYVTPF